MQYSCTLNDLIQIRISDVQKRRLMELARNRGLTLSDFLRQSAEQAAHQEAA